MLVFSRAGQATTLLRLRDPLCRICLVSEAPLRWCVIDVAKLYNKIVACPALVFKADFLANFSLVLLLKLNCLHLPMADSIESTANWDDPELEDASTKVQVHIYMWTFISKYFQDIVS